MTLNRALGITLISTLMLLTGCASVPKAVESEDAAAKQFRVPSDKGRVYIYRSAFMARAHLHLVDASKGRADVMQTSLLIPTLPEQ